MTALREVFAKFGIELDSGPLTQGDTAVSGLVGRLQSLGNVIAGAALVQGVRSFAAEFTNLADEIGDTSAALGVSTAALQEWRYAAELSGVASGQFDASLIRLQDQMAAGNPAFRQLGVSVRDASGQLRSATDVLSDLADPIAALPTDAARTGVLMDLLGRSGARMGPLFARGAEGIAELRQEFQTLGGGVTEDAAEAAGAYDDALVRLNVATIGLKARIAVFLLPALERLASFSTEVGRRLSAMADRGRIAEVTLAALGATAAVAGARTVAAWVAAAAPFVALAAAVVVALLIFEDLWVGLEGGRSTLGDLGTAFEEWAETAQGAIEPVALALEYIKGLIASLVQGIGLVFGENLLGDAAEMVGREGRPESELAGEIVARRREQGGMLGEFLMPDTFERALAIRDAQGILSGEQTRASVGLPAVAAARGPTTVTQSVQVRVDARGMSEEQAIRVGETAVRRALASEADDTLDTLAQGE